MIDEPREVEDASLHSGIPDREHVLAASSIGETTEFSRQQAMLYTKKLLKELETSAVVTPFESRGQASVVPREGSE